VFTLSMPNSRRWRIYRGNYIVLSGVGSVNQAVYIARLHGIVLTEFNNTKTLKAA